MSLITENIVAFSQFLRQRGLAPGVQQTMDAVEAAAAVDVADRATFKYALKIALCSSKTEWDLFDSLFEDFWKRHCAIPSSHQQMEQAKPAPVAGGPQMLSELSNGEHQAEDGRSLVGASIQERLLKADFSEVAVNDMAELERLAALLLAKLSQRISRRFRRTQTRGKRFDLRRTVSKSVSSGGVPLHICFKSPRPRPLKLALLLDISGSMNAYSLFLLRFAYCLQKHFHHVGSFIFSTHLEEITDALKTPDLNTAFTRLASHRSGWSGGTRIGESLQVFRERYGKRLLTRHTVFIVLSDGWDTGDPEMLSRQLSSIHSAVRKVIWLSPLLGMQDYQPLTRAIRAALPHIDVFVPAHNLESLLQLERHLHV
jgi:uncharacterized protein with von Willebrand factor type A (vWA) domain